MEVNLSIIKEKVSLKALAKNISNFSMKCLSLWLVGCFGFNGPLRQYFSLYPAVSQREGERGEKG